MTRLNAIPSEQCSKFSVTSLCIVKGTILTEQTQVFFHACVVCNYAISDYHNITSTEILSKLFHNIVNRS